MTKATIDRIEDETAVILVPKKDLPKGAKEGDVLNLAISPNLKATQTRKSRVKRLLRRLFPSSR